MDGLFNLLLIGLTAYIVFLMYWGIHTLLKRFRWVYPVLAFFVVPLLGVGTVMAFAINQPPKDGVTCQTNCTGEEACYDAGHCRHEFGGTSHFSFGSGQQGYISGPLFTTVFCMRAYYPTPDCTGRPDSYDYRRTIACQRQVEIQ